MRARDLLLGAALALAACGGKDKATTPVAPTPTAGEERAPAPAPATGDFAAMTDDQLCDEQIQRVEQLAAAIDGAQGDCDALGAAVQGWVDANRAFLAFSRQQEQDAARKEAFEKVCKARSDATLEKVGPTLQNVARCI